MAGIRALLRAILDSGQPNGQYLELLHVLLSIHFDANEWRVFERSRHQFLRMAGEAARRGWDRATRVYTDPHDRPQKPSYMARLVAYPDMPRRQTDTGGTLNQLQKIAADLSRKPGLSNLSFVILRPADLHDQFRPGYVPCAVAGDFKMRDDKLHLSVMFRTSDALSVGYADIYYMRRLQMDLLSTARSMPGASSRTRSWASSTCSSVAPTFRGRAR
jgi:thymidylate synthase